MSDPDPNAFQLSPVFQELWEIGQGNKPMPDSPAKRHHYVPQFLLRQFCGADGRLVQLDVRSGKPQQTTPRAAASRLHFYRFEDEDGGQSNKVEALFAMVETRAAPILQKLEESCSISDVERADISFFLALLWARTPAARQLVEGIAQQSAQLLMASHCGDPETFARMYREWKAEETIEDSQIEEMRRRILRQFSDGSLQLASPDGGAPTQMLLEASSETTMLIFGGMTWILMRSSTPGFITSDRGMAIFDPTPEFPWSMDAIYSSPNVETTIPISARTCLQLTPGNPGVQSVDVDSVDVNRINLRTYGWCDRHIYGSSQDVVAGVRRSARKKPQSVPRPKPFHQVVLVESAPGDTRLAEQHAKRGWPRYLAHTDESGRRRKMDYMVVGVDGHPVEVGVSSTEIAKRRALIDSAKSSK